MWRCLKSSFPLVASRGYFTGSLKKSDCLYAYEKMKVNYLGNLWNPSLLSSLLQCSTVLFLLLLSKIDNKEGYALGFRVWLSSVFHIQSGHPTQPHTLIQLRSQLLKTIVHKLLDEWHQQPEYNHEKKYFLWPPFSLSSQQMQLNGRWPLL